MHDVTGSATRPSSRIVVTYSNRRFASLLLALLTSLRKNDYQSFYTRSPGSGSHRAVLESAQILKEETFNMLCTPQVSKEIMPGRERGGLGVRVITDDSYPYWPKLCVP